jgi:hypothetical protein
LKQYDQLVKYNINRGLNFDKFLLRLYLNYDISYKILNRFVRSMWLIAQNFPNNAVCGRALHEKNRLPSRKWRCVESGDLWEREIISDGGATRMRH